MRTLFVEAYIKEDLTPLLAEIIKKVKAQKIGLVTTVQHIKGLDFVKEYLEREGFEVFIGKPAKNMTPKQGIYAFHAGQLLGCDATAALDIEENVDSFIYLGTGEFHPLHLAYDTDKPIWLANPLTKTVELLPEERKRKYFSKQAIRKNNGKHAKCYGFLVSTKPGQYYLNMAKRMLEEVRSVGKDGVILTHDTIVPNDLLNFSEVDCYVNTACPRIVEDQPNYPKTLINGTELREILDELKEDSKLL